MTINARLNGVHSSERIWQTRNHGIYRKKREHSTFSRLFMEIKLPLKSEHCKENLDAFWRPMRSIMGYPDVIVYGFTLPWHTVLERRLICPCCQSSWVLHFQGNPSRVRVTVNKSWGPLGSLAYVSGEEHLNEYKEVFYNHIKPLNKSSCNES